MKRAGSSLARAPGVIGAVALAALVAAAGCAQPGRSAAARRVADLDASDSAVVAPARWPGFPLLPNGRFPIGAWCGPPASQTTDARYDEYARAGFTVLLAALEDPCLPGPNRARLAMAARHGLFAVVRDARISPGQAESPGWKPVVDTVAATYAGEPALLAYLLSDEPPPSLYPALGAVAHRLAARDPRHPAVVNLMAIPQITYEGLPYSRCVERFLEEFRPALVTADDYVALPDSAGRGGDPDAVARFCAGWDTLRLVTRDVPYWAILLLTPHLRFPSPTEGQLAWEAHEALAHGARGIVWFTYWSPNPAQTEHYRGGPLAYDGTRNPSYGVISRLNARLEPLGRELALLTCTDVRQSGRPIRGGRPPGTDVPVRDAGSADLTLGFFAARDGRRSVLVVNRDWRNPAAAKLVSDSSLERWAGAPGRHLPARPTPATSRDPLVVRLGPGEAALFRLSSARNPK